MTNNGGFDPGLFVGEGRNDGKIKREVELAIVQLLVPIPSSNTRHFGETKTDESVQRHPPPSGLGVRFQRNVIHLMRTFEDTDVDRIAFPVNERAVEPQLGGRGNILRDTVLSIPVARSAFARNERSNVDTTSRS